MRKKPLDNLTRSTKAMPKPRPMFEHEIPYHSSKKSHIYRRLEEGFQRFLHAPNLYPELHFAYDITNWVCKKHTLEKIIRLIYHPQYITRNFPLTNLDWHWVPVREREKRGLEREWLNWIFPQARGLLTPQQAVRQGF